MVDRFNKYFDYNQYPDGRMWLSRPLVVEIANSVTASFERRLTCSDIGMNGVTEMWCASLSYKIAFRSVACLMVTATSLHKSQALTADSASARIPPPSLHTARDARPAILCPGDWKDHVSAHTSSAVVDMCMLSPQANSEHLPAFRCLPAQIVSRPIYPPIPSRRSRLIDLYPAPFDPPLLTFEASESVHVVLDFPPPFLEMRTITVILLGSPSVALVSQSEFGERRRQFSSTYHVCHTGEGTGCRASAS